MIGYWHWHWHTLHFGAETYRGGVLLHSGLPGQACRELAGIGGERETAGRLVTELVPDADVTMVYSMPSKWLIQEHRRCPRRTTGRAATRTTAS